jgi:SAM-dependent methyltransferase
VTDEAPPDYALLEYKRPNGSLDYENYVRCQARANRKKLRRIYIREEVVQHVVDYLHKYGRLPLFGLCHGTRRGNEQQWFMDRLPGCQVLGTEIAPTATQFPNTIQWDFHEIKSEWVGAVDFIYTNSLDHAYDPEKAVTNWMRCLTPTGLCFVEWWGYPYPMLSTHTDPFSATTEGLLRLLSQWGKEQYFVREVIPLHLKIPRIFRLHHHRSLIVLERTGGV